MADFELNQPDNNRNRSQLMVGMAQLRGELSAANPHLAELNEAMGYWHDAIVYAEAWERKNRNGLTCNEQSLLDLHTREMQRGKFWDSENGGYYKPEGEGDG